jgi:hypothetical protein
VTFERHTYAELLCDLHCAARLSGQLRVLAPDDVTDFYIEQADRTAAQITAEMERRAALTAEVLARSRAVR